MRGETRDWLEGLRDSVADRRVAVEDSAPDGQRAVAAAVRMILATHLTVWADEQDGWLAARRALARTSTGIDPEPAIVLTTSSVAIGDAQATFAAAGTTAGALGPRVAVVTELEYRRWCMRRADDAHRLHVTHWNWVKTRLPPQRTDEFRRHAGGAEDVLWLHRTGTEGAGDADRRDSHLWRWTGRKAVLVEAFVAEEGLSRFTRGRGRGSSE